ncbi:unnamed protein product [Closterium sp. Naga37s-1]|nr:unnamed protein product [Closterium sp. Naga37s-1]
MCSFAKRCPNAVRDAERDMYEEKLAGQELKQGATAAALDDALGAVSGGSGKKGKITDIFGNEAKCDKEAADDAICLMFAGLHLPESIADEELFRHAVRRDGVTSASEMMTDRCGRPRVNVLLVNDCAPVFVESVDCHIETKTGGYIASILSPILDKVGPENVVAVCTDGGRVAARKIATMWPHNEHVPCATHVLDLLMEDVGKMGWAKGVVERTGEMINYVRNHHFTCGFMRKGKGKQVLKPAGTRFGTQYIAVSRLCEVRRGLTQLVFSDEWKEWATGGKRAAAEAFRGNVMDEEWWKASDCLSSGDLGGLKHPTMDAPADAVMRVAQLALSCTAERTAARPSMSHVANELQAIREEVVGKEELSAAVKVDAQVKEKEIVASVLSLDEQLQFLDDKLVVG